jgi:cytochrome c oxidase cbb3-type subunit 2
MPDFIALNPQQLDDLVELLKHFSPRFTQQQEGVPLQVPPEPSNDSRSVGRGAQVYDRLKCANCHGWRGEGGPGAANLHNENGTVAHVTDFTRKQSLKCGESSSQIYTTLMTGLDGTPMSGYSEAISEQDAWDLVHYVMSIRN